MTTTELLAVLEASTPERRLSTGLAGFDRVLGETRGGDGSTIGRGAIVGAAYMLSGRHGVGKSTLVRQAALAWARVAPVLYTTVVNFDFCAEHALDRLAEHHGGNRKGVEVFATGNMHVIRERAKAIGAQVVVIDDLAKAYDSTHAGRPGSVGQGQAVLAQALRIARDAHAAVFVLSGEVGLASVPVPRMNAASLDGSLLLELVEPSLYALRASKVRGGELSEVGMFRMNGTGFYDHGTHGTSDA